MTNAHSRDDPSTTITNLLSPDFSAVGLILGEEAIPITDADAEANPDEDPDAEGEQQEEDEDEEDGD